MKKENENRTKDTDVVQHDLLCKCGKEAEISHCSNYLDGTGLFYAICSCGNKFNIRWHGQINLQKVHARQADLGLLVDLHNQFKREEELSRNDVEIKSNLKKELIKFIQAL